MKQLMAGGGVALIGTTLVPLLTGLFDWRILQWLQAIQPDPQDEGGGKGEAGSATSRRGENTWTT